MCWFVFFWQKIVLKTNKISNTYTANKAYTKYARRTSAQTESKKTMQKPLDAHAHSPLTVENVLPHYIQTHRITTFRPFIEKLFAEIRTNIRIFALNPKRENI